MSKYKVFNQVACLNYYMLKINVLTQDTFESGVKNIYTIVKFFTLNTSVSIIVILIVCT